MTAPPTQAAAPSRSTSRNSTSHAPAKPLGDFTTSPRVLLISGIAILVGVGGVLSGAALLALIRIATNIAYFGAFSMADLPFGASPLGRLAVLVPVAGALIIGLMARYGSEKIRGHGIPEAIEAILLGRSRLSAKVAVLKPLSSAISIGTGGPFGAEGPIIMTGGAIGSLIAQLLPVTDAERKTLLVAGAAAGMTAVFGTPIAAVMLAVELLLFEWTPRSFIPVVAASVTADLGRTWLGFPAPLFPFSGEMTVTSGAVLCWVLTGLLSGLLSGALTRLVYLFEDLFGKLPIHWMWWPAIGGLAVGLGGLLDPRALGVGYANIAHMLQGSLVSGPALTLLAVKAVIWAASLGSGTSGGVLAPLLIIGGAMGAALTPILPHASPGFWPLLAMSATMGGTMRSPLTATFFAAEITGNTHVLLPIVTACVTAHAVTVLLMRRSILTEKVARRGHHLAREYHVDPFVLTRVRAVMTTPVQTVRASMSLQSATTFLTSPSTVHPSFPVLNEAGHVLGILDPPSVLRWRRAGTPRSTPLSDLLDPHTLLVAHPDEYLDAVITRMSQTGASHLPVISREDNTLAGYLGWRDLMRVRQHVAALDRDRAAIYKLRRRVAGAGTVEHASYRVEV